MSLGVGLARDDVLWDLPSAVVGVCYLNSQPILGFKAGNEVEILNVRPKNGGAVNEAKICGQRFAGGINKHGSNFVSMPNWDCIFFF